jgi:hypothetical protein
MRTPDAIFSGTARRARLSYGERRAVTVQLPFASAVPARSQDTLVGSSSANGTTIIPCDLGQRDWPGGGGTTASRCGRPEP